MLGPIILVPAILSDERIFMRLIDADALINTLQELFDRRSDDARFSGSKVVDVSWNDAIYHIADAPTIDAVPVVRCRECIHSDDGWLCDSPFHGGRTFPGDYCSNGERREDRLYESLKRGLEEAIAYENGEIECRTETREEGDAQ